ncbi:MAG TPA: UbiD family decarboxylase [Acidimicrobiales bacterium]|nr:UbiD family decarboxylase [Acidimicrobiales bacterium]
MSAFDLRRWLAAVAAAGHLEEIHGAAANLEIGAASQLNYRRGRPRALMFDDIPGHRPGERVLTGSLCSPALMGMALGLGGDLDDHRLTEVLRGKPSAWRAAAGSYGVRQVDGGPVFDNVVAKDQVDFARFPCPVWHEDDGGPYVGTGCGVVTTDPEDGTLNLGAYRMQVQDDGASVSINIESGKHGAQHVRKWFEREGRAPVAASLGHHPVFLAVAGTEVPLGVSELDYAGAILGEAVPVVRCPDTGLLLPAESELAFEGWLYPDRVRPEGPFGEWTGYYSEAQAPVLTVEVTGLFHRNDPINLGAPPGKPPHDYSYMRSVMKSAMATDALSDAGLAGLGGVWCHEAGGGRSLIVVALEQRYAGHSRQAGYLAAQHPVTAYMNRLVITVDQDVNPRDLAEVMWAVSTRCDPARDVDVMRYGWGSRVDPLSLQGAPAYNSRLLIDACRPYERLGDFPAVAEARPEVLDAVLRRWPGLGV